MTTREPLPRFPRTPESVVRAFGGEPSRADVWIFDRTTPEFASLAERGPVSAEARTRARALQDPVARADLLSRRAALRRVLALYLSRHRESIRIVTLPGGKPTFVPEPGDDRRLSFSSGYSHDVFCLAVGTSTSLGVDVELERPVPRALGIASRWFSPEESDALRVVQQDRLAEEFLRLWTAKEALAKRHSAGLRLMSGPVDELDVRREMAKNTLVHFAPRVGYVASLASTSSIDDIRLVSEPSRHI